MSFGLESVPRDPQIGAAEFAWLRDLLRRKTGVALEPDKAYLAETRLGALAHAEGFDSLRALLDGLETEEEWGILHRRVVDAMMITETSFFRDLRAFEALRDTVLPGLIDRRMAERSLNIWCAACASGQEPYSVAMLIREHFPMLMNWNLRIIGTDVSETMLERARAGLYSQIEINRGLPAQLLVRWFERLGNEWRIRDPIRRMVELRDVNLAGPLPGLPAMDLILLRNVLLYFDDPTRRTVLAAVARVLRPDGALFLGGGESTLTLDDRYEPLPLGRVVCYRLRAA